MTRSRAFASKAKSDLLFAIAIVFLQALVAQGHAEGDPVKVDTLEVSAQRTPVTERQLSTASKTVVSGEELKQYGDANVADALKRLPGVTTSGRGGALGMRGLAGMTQILVNGQRLTPGLSLAQIPVDQVERVEIIRVVTPETGTQAIAGTINIILKPAARKSANDVRATLSVEDGRPTSNVAWTQTGAFSDTGSHATTVSVTGGAGAEYSGRDQHATEVSSRRVLQALRREHRAETQSQGASLGSRIQWKLGGDERFSLDPMLSVGKRLGREQERVSLVGGTVAPPYASSLLDDNVLFVSAGLTVSRSGRYDEDTIYEARTSVNFSRFEILSLKQQFAPSGALSGVQSTSTLVDTWSFNSSAKATRRWGETHKLVYGAEAAGSRQLDRLTYTSGGQPYLGEFEPDSVVRSARGALYVQDEWDANDRWSMLVGARLEGMHTTSGGVTSTNAVMNPVAHVLLRFDEKGRNQARLSLTQSYQAPGTAGLLARPRINSNYPLPGTNVATEPDSQGNPNLKPEIANGLEVAFEHYLSAKGLLSANVFYRHLRDVIRYDTQLELPSWSEVPRYVTRSRNLGTAWTAGLELEGKFRLDELVATAPPVNVRASLSLYRSMVSGVPAPDNRLLGQPDMTGNLSLDYAIRGTPLVVGGFARWTPAYDIRDSVEQFTHAGRRETWDAYLLWNRDKHTKVRLSATTRTPSEIRFEDLYLSGDLEQGSISRRHARPTFKLQLELKLS